MAYSLFKIDKHDGYDIKKVYSFEASNKNFNKIKKNLELNNISNVVPVETALGSKVDEILFLDGDDSCTMVSKNLKTNNMVKSTTLDKFVETHNLNVGLIKVDIEGFEQDFLYGARNTIKTQRPALLISIYHNFNDFMYIKKIIQSWDLGYTFRIDRPKESFLLETLLIAEVLD